MKKMNMYVSEANRRRASKRFLYGWLVVSAVLAAYSYATLDAKKPPKVKPDITLNCSGCHSRTLQFTEYFKKHKVKNPEMMATACLETNSPRLLAAMNVAGERKTPWTARKTGYKNRHSGAWQVSEKDWGPVPHDPILQARKTEDILEDLVKTKNIRSALQVYGGDSTDAYASRVLQELSRVP